MWPNLACMKDLSNLCIHTITTKPWDFATAVQKYSAAGVKGISIWRDAIEGISPAEVKRMLADHDLTPVSYVRGGFFPSTDPAKRAAAIDENREIIDEAASIGSPLVVLVCGADPNQSLNTSRQQIQEGIETLIPHAEANQVKLAIEPLHPMYADTRSAVNTLQQGNDMAEAINSPWVGIAVDVYHLWWEADLEAQIMRCGQHGNLLAYHICDWKSPTLDMLNDRGNYGRGLHSYSTNFGLGKRGRVFRLS